MSPDGQTLGYMAEEGASSKFAYFSVTNGSFKIVGRAIGRQLMRSHRPFRCTVMSPSGEILFRISRPFAFINSKIYISLGEDESNIIGEAQQEWHPWRRRYNMYQVRPAGLEQFARIDAPFLSWDFQAQDAEGKVMASISKNFTGFARELFTDTSQYVLKFDAVDLELQQQQQAAEPSTIESKDLVPVHHGLTLDQRAILLASAFTTDIDYFSRHSSGPGFVHQTF
jgi:uncharacterized protein YxjI